MSESPSAEELERLVQHFVAAKRSLASATLVSRAHEIVTDGRNLVEEVSVLTAKNAFVRKGVVEEANVLDSVRDALESTSHDAQADFKTVVRRLDDANDGLQATLVQLQKIQVDTSILQSRGEPDAQKTLFDFIDEASHHNLIESLRVAIDSYNQAHGEFESSQDAFADHIRSVHAAIQDADQALDPQTTLQPCAPLYHGLTNHATETASLLTSLVSHYDLCASALKHTEGGGEAARQATHPTLDDDPQQGPEDSVYRNQPLGPMSEQERQEMLAVVDNDAQEVDDVILEIRERLSEMELQLSQLEAHSKAVCSRHKLLNRVLDLLRKIGGHLPVYIAAAKTFGTTWTSLKQDMTTKTEEVANLTGFYDSFITSYSSLLREVNRRQAVESRMQRIADKARREIDLLYNQDVALRQEFFHDTGEYLPKDIWPGLEDAPKRWEIKAISPESPSEDIPEDET